MMGLATLDPELTAAFWDCLFDPDFDLELVHLDFELTQYAPPAYNPVGVEEIREAVRKGAALMGVKLA